MVFTDYEESEVAWKLMRGIAVDNGTNIGNPAWNIIHQDLETSNEDFYNLKEDGIIHGKVSKLIYNVTLKREPLTAIVYVICPTVAISTFNIISFVLPTGEG